MLVRPGKCDKMKPSCATGCRIWSSSSRSVGSRSGMQAAACTNGRLTCKLTAGSHRLQITWSAPAWLEALAWHTMLTLRRIKSTYFLCTCTTTSQGHELHAEVAAAQKAEADQRKLVEAAQAEADGLRQELVALQQQVRTLNEQVASMKQECDAYISGALSCRALSSLYVGTLTTCRTCCDDAAG